MQGTRQISVGPAGLRDCRWRTIAVVAAVSLLLALSIASSDIAGAGEYQLVSGDVVNVTVFGHADLTTKARISDTGKIAFPLIGEITIVDLTTLQASKRIELALGSGGFVLKPQVTLNVESVHSPLVSILGEVYKPGKYPTHSPEGDDVKTVSDLLALAGGPKENAADYLTLTQRTASGQTTQLRVDLIALLRRGDSSHNLPIKSGDILFVPRMETFYIYGEVQKPGAYRLERGMTLMQALAVGGGLTPRGTQRGVEVRRHGKEDKLETIKPSLEASLQPDDVIYVKESWF